MTGFWRGTFDITISEDYDADLALFRQKYPAMSRYTVERAVLPPWTRPSDEEMK